MEVRVRLFAGARAIVGAPTLSAEIPENSTIEDLRRELNARSPELSGLLNASRFAIEAEYVDDDAVIPSRSEVSVIPPVSGGWASF